MLRLTAVRALNCTTVLRGRVNDVGSTAWEHTLSTGFQVGAHEYAGRLPVGVQDPATDVVVNAPLTRHSVTAVQDT